MKKATLSVGLFLCALAFLSPAQTQALPLSESAADTSLSLSKSTLKNGTLAVNTKKPATDKKPAEKTAVTSTKEISAQHAVVGGESLTMIADKHATTWIRLFAKNTQIADPNVIKVGETITIPLASEQVPDRPLPTPPPQAVVTLTQPANQTNTNYAPSYGGNSAGNTYYAGYCTWYAKNRRPDLPNNLGNANEWVYRAQAQGIATGSAPSVGAIGQQGMHVVYVESVNGDGTVSISEMNYQGLYVTSTRTVPAGSFAYIY